MDRYLYKRSTEKAEQNKKRERELDEIIPIQDLSEPFSTDEEEEYVLPATKTQKKTETDKVSRPKKKKNNNPDKQLSRVERLARLKMKSKIFEEAKKAAAVTEQNESKKQNSCATTQINHDVFFTQKLPTQETPSKGTASCVLRDHFIEEKKDSPLKVTPAQHKVVPHDVDNNQKKIHDALSFLMAKMEELNDSVGLLRRQVARVEAKSQFKSGSTDHRCDKTDDIYMDFDAVCKSEGFPISTCDEVADFNEKLKNSSYRQKIVSHFTCLLTLDVRFINQSTIHYKNLNINCRYLC